MTGPEDPSIILRLPFVFVPHGAPEPVEWRKRHAGMLKAGATDAEVVAYLDEVEREDMGISRPSGDKPRFVAAVRAAMSGSAQVQ